MLCVSVRARSAPGALPAELRLPKMTEVTAGGGSLAVTGDAALGFFPLPVFFPSAITCTCC